MLPASTEYRGRFRFPGTYAFLDTAGDPAFALLQFDDPYTGVFDPLAAEDTCLSLRENHQDGDPADLTGDLVMCDVGGRDTRVLFLF